MYSLKINSLFLSHPVGMTPEPVQAHETEISAMLERRRAATGRQWPGPYSQC